MTVSDQSDPALVTPPVAPRSTELPTSTDTSQILTLPPTALPTLALAIDPKTAEPRRGWPVRLAAGSFWLSSAATGVALLKVYWDAVSDVTSASMLTSWFADPTLLTQVLLVVAVTAIGLLVAISSVITGYYAWFGYRWSRVSGLISAALSLLAVLLNPIGLVTASLAIIAAALLWLPSTAGFFASWQALRNPQPEFQPPATEVFYGPLPRYRRD